MTLTIVLIAITTIVSLAALGKAKVMDDLLFYPAWIHDKNQFYRFLTYGFVHADLMHLIFNMYAFYLFGDFIEKVFGQLFGPVQGKIFYLLLYLLALIASVIPDYKKNMHNYQYRSLGASGAVSAVVFAFIILNPMQGIGLIFLPIFIPGFIFGILFLVISYYLGKRGGSRINHSAHIYGAIFGVIFLLVVGSQFSDFPVLQNFIYQVQHMKMDQLFQTY